MMNISGLCTGFMASDLEGQRGNGKESPHVSERTSAWCNCSPRPHTTMGHAGCQACCHKGSGLKTEWKPEDVTQEMTDASIAADFGGDLERARESGRGGLLLGIGFGVHRLDGPAKVYLRQRLKGS